MLIDFLNASPILLGQACSSPHNSADHLAAEQRHLGRWMGIYDQSLHAFLQPVEITECQSGSSYVMPSLNVKLYDAIVLKYVSHMNDADPLLNNIYSRMERMLDQY